MTSDSKKNKSKNSYTLFVNQYTQCSDKSLMTECNWMICSSVSQRTHLKKRPKMVSQPQPLGGCEQTPASEG